MNIEKKSEIILASLILMCFESQQPLFRLERKFYLPMVIFQNVFC